MIKWRRVTMESDVGPYFVYVTDEEDWSAWSIDRVPVPKSQRHFRFQVKYQGSPIGSPVSRLRDAKARVETQGRDGDDDGGVDCTPRRESPATSRFKIHSGETVRFIDGPPSIDLLTRVRDGLRNL